LALPAASLHAVLDASYGFVILHASDFEQRAI